MSGQPQPPMSATRTHEPTLSIRLLWPIVRAVGSGPRSFEFLEQMGIAADDLADRDMRIACSVAMDGLQRAVEAFGVPELGLRAGLDADTSVFDVAEYAARASANLGEAMRVMARYSAVMNEGARASVIIEGSTAYFRYLPTVTPSPPALNDFVITSSLEFCRRNCVSYLPPREVWVMHDRPAYADAYRDYIKAPVRFGAPFNGTVMDAAFLEVPMREQSADMAAAFERRALALLQNLGHDSTVSDRVRDALAEQFATGGVQMADTARRLGMGVATLRRKLADEGTSFSAILEEMRKEAALRSLRRDESTVSELAFMLGFSDVRAFGRAFKRWTGMVPTEFRSEHRTGASTDPD